MKCANCKQKPEVYCVDCNKSMCRFCTALLHHPTTNGEDHSLEEIAKFRGYKIITPILLDLLLLGGLFTILMGSSITPEYFSGASYCPGVGKGRAWFAWFDASIHYYFFKARLSFFCDLEDSFWRLFMDTWLRGIVTGSDSWLLIITTFFGAWVFDKLITAIAAPLVGAVYSLVATAARELELRLQKYVIDNSTEEHQEYEREMFQAIQDTVAWLSITGRLSLTGKKIPPPITHLRVRPKKDNVEHMRYLWKRTFRLHAYNEATAEMTCRFLLKWSIYVAAGIRVFCMLFGRTPFLILARIVGLGKTARQHAAWMQDHTGIPPLTQNAYWTDWLFMNTVSRALSHLPFVGSHVQEVGVGLIFGARPLLIKFIIPALVGWGLRYSYKKYIQKQQAEYKKNWEAETRKKIWGNCSRENPCAEWNSLRFSNSKHIPVS